MKPDTSIVRQDLEQFFDECEPRITISGIKHNTVKARTSVQIEEIKSFFSDLDFRLEIQNRSKSQLDRRLAREFSVFKFIDPDENGLSDILKMLLDPRGAHGQKDLFLKLFLARLGRSLEPSLQDPKVVREALTHTISSFLRRIDILITSEHLALALENKVDAGDQRDQLKDYHAHIQGLYRNDYCLVFLTPDGREPEAISISKDAAIKLRHEKRLFELSYAKDIRQWLEECRRWCEAENIRDFLADFIHHIESYLSSHEREVE